MRFIPLVVLLWGAASLASERKSIDEVDVNRLTTETQVTSGGSDELNLVWWIPSEFWAATFTQDASLPQESVEQLVEILRPYSMLAVVQADISPLGAFDFFDREQVTSGLQVELVRDDGLVVPVALADEVDPNVSLLLEQMRPILGAAMGSMGQNFYFFALPDRDAKGNRLLSPYEEGVLQVQLSRRQELPPAVLQIELPLDSLMVPRLCPNGKPAHVSWNFCPWGGEKL